MPRYVQVGGDSGNEGTYDTYQTGDFGGNTPPPEYSGAGSPMQPMPEVQNLSQHFYDNPANVGRVYMDALTDPNLRNTPGFDWAGVQSLYDHYSKSNPGKSYYEWGSLADDDPMKLYAQALTVPDYLKTDENYKKMYDENGVQIAQPTYTPTPSDQVPAAGTEQKYNSPLEAGVIGALPVIGKTMGTLGTAAQGAQALGLPGLIGGGIVGYGMSSVDPNKTDAQRTWYEKLFKGIGDVLQVPIANVEGMIGAGMADSARKITNPAQGYDPLDINRDGQLSQQEKDSAFWGTGGVLLRDMLFGSPEAKKAAQEQWQRDVVQAGSATFESSLSHGAISVPSKAISNISRMMQDRPQPPAGAHYDQHGLLWGQDGKPLPAPEQPNMVTGVVIPAIQDAWKRRDEVWGFGPDQRYTASTSLETGNATIDKLANLALDPEMVSAYNDVKTMMDQGYTADQATQAVKGRYGLGGVLNDLAGNIALDPLNLVGLGETEILTKLAKANKLWENASRVEKILNLDAGLVRATGKILNKLGGESDVSRMGWVSRMLGDTSKIGDDPALARALDKGGDAIEVLRNYGAEVRSSGADEAAKYGYLTRKIAGVDAAGNYTRFKPLTSDPTLWQKIGDTFFHGTREARATEFLQHIQQSIAGDLANLDNADDIVRFYKQLASMSPQEAVDAASKGLVTGWTDNVMSQSAPAAVRNNLDKLLTLKRAFDNSRSKAMMFEKLGEVLGIDARHLINKILKADDMELENNFQFWKTKMEEAANAGDPRAAAALKEMGNGAELKTAAMRFKVGRDGAGVPLNLNEFKANALHLMGRGVEDFAAKYFGLNPRSFGWQLQNFIRKTQGVLLLGLNPSYMMNNVINNVITLMWDGLFNLGDLANRKAFLERFGMPILRLNEGSKLDTVRLQKLGNDFMKAGTGGEVLRKAQKAKGMLSKATESVSDVADRVSVMAAMSGDLEGMSREMATIAGLREALPQIWQRDVGYTSVHNVTMPDGRNLGQVLDSIAPGLGDAVDNGVGRGMTMDEIKSNVLGKIDSPLIQDVISADDQHVLSVFPSIVDDLNKMLSDAKTTQDKVDAFRIARDRITEAMHNDVKAKAEDWALKAAQATYGEGFHATLDLLDNMGDQTADFLADHFQRMQDAAEQAHLLRDEGNPDAANAVWRQARKEADERWAVIRDVQTAKLVGAAKGLGAKDVVITRIKENMLEMQKVWDDFYDEVNKVRDQHAETTFVDAQSRETAYSALNKRLDRAYRKVTVAERRIQGKLDTIFGDMMESQFPGSRDQALAWRKTVADGRRLQTDAMTAFRSGEGLTDLPADVQAKIAEILDGKELTGTNGLNVEQREVAWKRFIDEVYEPMIVKRETDARIAGRDMLQSKPGMDNAVTAEEKAAIRAAKLQGEQALADAQSQARAQAQPEAPRSVADVDQEIAALQQDINQGSFIVDPENPHLDPREPMRERLAALQEEKRQLQAAQDTQAVEGVNDAHQLDEQIRIVQGNRDTLARDIEYQKANGGDEGDINEMQVQLGEYENQLADLASQRDALRVPQAPEPFAGENKRMPEGEALRKKIDSMAPEEKDATIKELRKQLTTSEKTGLQNGRAYHAAEKKPTQIMVDVSGLKKVNDTWGHEAGDNLLRNYGQVLYGIAGDDVYHISGDEFVIQADSVEAAQAIVEKINQELENFRLTVADKTGREVMLAGFEAHTGIGDTMGHADNELNRIKAARPKVNGDARLNNKVHEVGGTGNAGEVPLTAAQTAQATRTMLSGFADLNGKDDAVLAKAINKYTGKKYTAKDVADGKVSLIDVQIAMQRRSVAKALGYRGREANNKLKALEERLGISLQDYDVEGGPQAIKAPLGATERMSGLPPFEEAVLEGWTKNILPALKRAEKGITEAKDTNFAKSVAGLPQDVRDALDAHFGTVEKELTEAKQAALKVAQGRTDFALLNYSDRYGFDNIASSILPYQFWYTRSMRNWFLRVMAHPNILGTYMHIQNAAAAVPQDDLPTRMQGKIRVKLPFLPEEYGGEVFIDPMKQAFPMTQLIKPLIQMDEDTNMLNKRAESILRQKLADGTISADEAGMGLKDHNSDAWKKAMAQAKTEVDVDIRNPGDFISSMSGFNLPLQWLWQAYNKTPDRISQLPVSKTIQNLTYAGGKALGMDISQGLDIEQPVRNALGVPQDRYKNIGIDRAMASISREAAARGGKVTLLDGSEITATPEDFNQQLVDRQGPLYDLAVDRNSTIGAGKWLGSSLNPDVIQQGEREQRSLNEEYNAAMDSGDPEAYAKFQAAHPEYSTQKMAWTPEEDRVKTYMKNLVWATYMSLNPAIKQDVTDALGPKFQDYFLNKDTRNYDQISSEELSQWAKTMGAKGVAQSVDNIPGVSVKFSSKDVVDKLGTYYEQYETQFPGLREWFDKSGYYDKTQEEQDKLALDFPQISMYNKWRETYLAQNPEIISRVISESSPVYGLPQNVQQAYFERRALRDTLFPGILKLQEQYFSSPKGSAQRRALASSTPLPTYWAWSRAFDAEHEAEKFAWKSDNKTDATESQQGDANAWVTQAVQDMSPELSRRMLNYVAYNQEPSAAAKSELDILRKQFQPGIGLDDFLQVMSREIRSRYITQQ